MRDRRPTLVTHAQGRNCAAISLSRSLWGVYAAGMYVTKSRRGHLLSKLGDNLLALLRASTHSAVFSLAFAPSVAVGGGEVIVSFEFRDSGDFNIIGFGNTWLFEKKNAVNFELK